MTEGIMSWEVQLRVFSNNAMPAGPASAEEGGLVWGIKSLIQYISLSCENGAKGLMTTDANL